MSPTAVLDRLRNRPILAAILAAVIVVAVLLTLLVRPSSSATTPAVVDNVPLAAAQVPVAQSPATSPSTEVENGTLEPGTVIAPVNPSGADDSAASSETTTDDTAVPNTDDILVNPKSLPIAGGYTPPAAAQEPLTMTQPVGALYQRQVQGSTTTNNFSTVTSLPSDPAVVGYIQATFPQEEWSRAERIAGCESGMKSISSKPNSNGSRDHGIFQLNDGGTLQGLLRSTGQDPSNVALALDAKWNVQAAYVLWQQRGWQPWACSSRLGIVDGLWSSTPGPNW